MGRRRNTYATMNLRVFATVNLFHLTHVILAACNKPSPNFILWESDYNPVHYAVNKPGCSKVYNFPNIQPCGLQQFHVHASMDAIGKVPATVEALHLYVNDKILGKSTDAVGFRAFVQALTPSDQSKFCAETYGNGAPHDVYLVVDIIGNPV